MPWASGWRKRTFLRLRSISRVNRTRATQRRSPDGTLIVFGGPVVGGRVPILCVRPDRTKVDWPNVLARLGGGYRFLSNSKIVYLERGQSTDFTLLDLASQTTRPLTHLSAQGGLKTFDITPDGKQIVFDRSHENSDIYLIDLPKP